MVFLPNVVALIGLSPPVVTSCIDYLDRRRAWGRKLGVVGTSHPKVVSAARVVEGAVLARWPRAEVNGYFCKAEDVATLEELAEFIETCGRAVREHSAAGVYLLAAGGRKTMAAAAVLVAQLLGASKVLHVIHRDVELVNTALEQVRPLLEEVAAAKDPAEAYRRYSSKLDSVMYPDPREYTVVEIPVLPYPRGELLDVVGALRGVEAHRPSNWSIDRLVEAGLLQKTPGGKLIPTPEGRVIGEALAKALGAS